MTRLKKLIFLTFIIIISVSLSGCWDYQEIGEIAYVQALGIDRGKENKLTITAQIAVPGKLQSGSGDTSQGKGNPFEVVSVESPSVMASLNLMNTFVNRRISLKHTRIIIISEDFARDGTLPYLEVISRLPQVRRSIMIGVSKGISAKELLEKNQPVFEITPSKYIDMAAEMSQYTGFSPFEPQFLFFYNAARSLGADPVAPLLSVKRKTPQGEGKTIDPQGWISEGSYRAGEIPRSGGNEVEIMGAALFRGNKLVGDIDGDEMTALAILRNTFHQAYFSLPDPMNPERITSVNLFQKQGANFEFDLTNPTPKVKIQVFLKGDVLGIQTHANYEDPQYRNILENGIAEKMKSDIVKLLQHTQSLGVDPAWIGEKAKMHFLTDKEWEDYNWKSVYPKAEIEVDVKADLKHFGLIRENSPFPSPTAELAR
ncbi:MAG: Ger(x)C family spore germination protein [Firmicutes bacterium]|nr:Ger(x)C family spore germination protein [Bacillota bacterium]